MSVVKRELSEIADHMEKYGQAVGVFWTFPEFTDEPDAFSPCCLVGAFYAVREGREEANLDNVVDWFDELMQLEDETARTLVELAPEVNSDYEHMSADITRVTEWSDHAYRLSDLTTPLREKARMM